MSWTWRWSWCGRRGRTWCHNRCRTHKVNNVVENGVNGNCNIPNRAATTAMMKANHFVGISREDRRTRSTAFCIARIRKVPVPRIEWSKAALPIGRLDFTPGSFTNVAVKNGNFLVESSRMLGDINLFTDLGLAIIELQVPIESAKE